MSIFSLGRIVTRICPRVPTSGLLLSREGKVGTSHVR